jgi:sigma-B regulation protein RsbU (phosphoserine phosphatase)
MRFAPDVQSPVLARRMLRAALLEAGLDDLVDVVVLLGSELCDNAVLHAGTEFEVTLEIDGPVVKVVVSDHGPGPLELHLAMPRSGRAATHGRGLMLVERMASEWGTTHAANGRHDTWFVLRSSFESFEERTPAPLVDEVSGRTPRRRAGCCTCRPS